MDKRTKIIFSNQVTGYLFIDVVNAFTDEYDRVLFTGQVDAAGTQLQPSIHTKYLIRYNRNHPVKRIFTWLTYTVQLFFYVLFQKRGTQLFLVTNPPSGPFIGYIFNKLRGTTYHLLVYDIYPDALVNMGTAKKGGFIDRIWSKWNKGLFRNAATIYTLSDNMAALIKTYAPQVTVNVIYNWTDTSFIKPVNKAVNNFAISNSQADRITVMYSGNMGATHAVEKIADLAAAFRNDPAFGFMLIGDGAKKETIRKMKEAQALENLLMLPYQPHDVLPYSLACADIGIVTLSAGAEDLSVPSKTYNLLAAGVALLVIASPNSELARLVTHYDCGVRFDEHDIDGMAAFLGMIKNDPARLKSMKENARKASFDFTPANAVKYKQMLNSNKTFS